LSICSGEVLQGVDVQGSASPVATSREYASSGQPRAHEGAPRVGRLIHDEFRTCPLFLEIAEQRRDLSPRHGHLRRLDMVRRKPAVCAVVRQTFVHSASHSESLSALYLIPATEPNTELRWFELKQLVNWTGNYGRCAARLIEDTMRTEARRSNSHIQASLAEIKNGVSFTPASSCPFDKKHRSHRIFRNGCRNRPPREWPPAQSIGAGSNRRDPLSQVVPAQPTPTLSGRPSSDSSQHGTAKSIFLGVRNGAVGARSHSRCETTNAASIGAKSFPTGSMLESVSHLQRARFARFVGISGEVRNASLPQNAFISRGCILEKVDPSR